MPTFRVEICRQYVATDVTHMEVTAATADMAKDTALSRAEENPDDYEWTWGGFADEAMVASKVVDIAVE
jgi:hypothetical protein